MKSIYIYGASGHGLVVADIARTSGYNDIIFIDDGQNEYQTFEEIKENIHIPIAFGIGNNKIREILFRKVKNCNFKIVTLVHPNAIVSSFTSLGDGVVVMPNVVVNTKAKIGDGVILNTGCIVEHECIIDDFAHISPNVALAGNVKVGAKTQIGIGSSVIQGITIGKNSFIGAGSVVIKDIQNNIKAYGNPCREVEEINE